MEQGRQVGHYILEELLGEGGMGNVWKARHMILDRVVAIKVVHDALRHDDEFAARFRQEATKQSQLDHPSIVRVIDFFIEGGQYFMVMDYIDGEPLDKRLERAGGALPLAESLDIATQILSALDRAHSRGVIHRDIKPSNILLGHNGRAYLTDFGIALGVGETRKTSAGTALGTPSYMSPEQIVRPKAIDFRTDVYSFGCVLFECVTGHPPFNLDDGDGDTEFRIKQMHIHSDPPSPRILNPDVPPLLDAIILTALEKNPDNRFAGSGELLHAIREVLDPDVPPPPPSDPPLPYIAPVSKGLRLTAYFGIMALGFLLAVAAVAAAGESDSATNNEVAGSILVIAIMAAIPCGVLPLLHRAWSAIADEITPIRPGAAVGRLFIPVYNFFWMFRAYGSFPEEYNAFLHRYRIEGTQQTKATYIAFCIVTLLLFIPVPQLSVVALLVQIFIVTPLLMSSFCEAINTIASASRSRKILTARAASA